MLVMKFGGSSVGNSDMIEKTAEIIVNYGSEEQVVVVTSAVRGVTDRLLDIVQAAAEGNGDFRTKIDALIRKHTGLVNRLGLDDDEKVSRRIDEEKAKLTEICESVSVLGELTPKTADRVASFGERLSAEILASKLRNMEFKAGSLDAREIIVTDDNFGFANPLPQHTEQRSKKVLGSVIDSSVTPVVTGFTGATLRGSSTTLGRGGSDYTATLLGKILDARAVWIWTDVDGVLTADPRVVSGSFTLPRLSYEEAAELSYFGAEVLYPRSIDPAAQGGFPIVIKNTYNPTGPSTIISNDEPAPPGIKSVTAISDLSIITVRGHGMLGVPGIAAKTFEAVADEEINVFMISQSSSEQNITFMVESSREEAALKALRQKLKTQIDRKEVAGVYTEAPASIVAAVGSGLRTEPGMDVELFQSLAGRDVNLLSIAQGSSDHNISVAVNGKDEAKALRAIHEYIQISVVQEKDR